MRAYLYDADGVLLEGGKFSTRMAVQLGIPPEHIRRFFEGPFLECVEGKRDLKEELSKALEHSGLEHSPDQLMKMWFEDCKLVDAVAADIMKHRQQGSICCLATNQEKHRLAFLRQKFGLDRMFDHIFASCEMGCRKPQHEFFEHIHATLDIPKEEMILFDDRQENIDAALVFGIKARLWTTTSSFFPHTP